MDWLLDLENLANLGSLAGFISALALFFIQRRLRKHYMLLTRGTKLLSDLDGRASALNSLLDALIHFSDPQTERRIKHELNQCRSTIRGLKSKVRWRTRRDLGSLQRTIKRARDNPTENQVFDIYSELQRIALDVQNHIEDLKMRA